MCARRLTLALVLAGNALRNSLLFVKEAGIVVLPAWTHGGIGLATFPGDLPDHRRARVHACTAARARRRTQHHVWRRTALRPLAFSLKPAL
jgi:hypothetical protein